MGQVITRFYNLARSKEPIAVRRLNKIEGRQLLPTTSISSSSFSPASSPSSATSTTTLTTTITTSTTSSLTQSDPQPTTSTIVSSGSVFTTLSISTAASATLSSPTLTNSLTPTPAPSPIHDYRVPLIVVGCISGIFILITAIVFIIRHLRKTRHVQLNEALSTIFGLHIPQPRPMIGGTLHEQQPSSSDKVDLSLPAMKQHAQRDHNPSSTLLRPGRQQSSSQVGHLQRQLAHSAGAPGSSDHEEPPAYVP